MWTNNEAATHYFNQWINANENERKNSLIYPDPVKKANWYFLDVMDSQSFIRELARTVDNYLYNDGPAPMLLMCLAIRNGAMNPILVIDTSYEPLKGYNCDHGTIDFSKAMVMTLPVDFGEHITTQQEKVFALRYDATPIDEIDSLFYLNEDPCKGKLVTYYAFSTKDIEQLIIANASFVSARLTITMGSSPHEEDWHPVEFRPILGVESVLEAPGELEDSGSSRYYWDFSQPCPPNCGSGN